MFLTKKCGGCDGVLDLNSMNFHKDTSSKDGFHRLCKKCKNEESKESYHRNKKSILKRKKKKREANKLLLQKTVSQNKPVTNVVPLNEKKKVENMKISIDNIITSQVAALFSHNPTPNQVEQLAQFLLELSQSMKKNDRTIVNNSTGN